MSSEKLFNISQAAKAAGKSIPTIRAYLDQGKLPNAKSTNAGKTRTWQIPLTDLVAAGLMDQVKSEPGNTASANSALMELREQNAALRAENAQLLARIDELKQARADLIAAYAPRIETAEAQTRRRLFWARKPR
jgi:DNA-binding transcriptional MerR regulator